MDVDESRGNEEELVSDRGIGFQPVDSPGFREGQRAGGACCGESVDANGDANGGREVRSHPSSVRVAAIVHRKGQQTGGEWKQARPLRCPCAEASARSAVLLLPLVRGPRMDADESRGNAEGLVSDRGLGFQPVDSPGFR